MKLVPLILLVLLLPIFEARPQQVERILPAPKSNLVAVHWPDLSTVEAEVRGHLSEAQSSLTTVVNTVNAGDATLSEAYGSAGQTFHAYSFNSTAKECYVNASRLAPKDFRWIYLIAKLDQQDGRVDDAIKNYVMVQSLNPSYAAASINLGNIFLEANRLAEARRHFAAALKIDANSPAAHYGLGQVALSERNYAEAVKYFERTLAIVSAATRVHYSLAMAYRGLGELEKAKDHLRLQGTVGVRVADPLVDQFEEIIQGERLHLIRGRTAMDAKRYAEAANEFRKVVAASPDSVAGRVNLGAALNLLGDQAGALQQFEEALRISPENANAHFNLAVLLTSQNRHREAITHLQSVIASNPRDSSARSMLAQAYLRSGKDDLAQEQFARIVEADPGNEQALLSQAQLLFLKKQYKQALDILEKSHATFPDKTATSITLARILATSPSHDLRNGARAFELAQRTYRATGSLEHAAVISMALAELGRCADAVEWQRKLIGAAERAEQISVGERLKKDLQLYERSPCRP
ncbi:MAG TPA: tetratricopeptide repeat protein [Pyrinomonadaceae bacterium]|nr:tetratricopeptide repeat protein [Pyrinomonadaceae bacterium]